MNDLDLIDRLQKCAEVIRTLVEDLEHPTNPDHSIVLGGLLSCICTLSVMIDVIEGGRVKGVDRQMSVIVVSIDASPLKKE